VPDLPNGAVVAADANEEKTTQSAEEEGSEATKSPLSTAHRISVTSDMDDVSLDEGRAFSEA
jgi:hypothetical protein